VDEDQSPIGSRHGARGARALPRELFFADLCTPAELEALVDRWAVVKYLQDGLPYRKIHDLTGVSVTTIGRVARFLIAGNGGYQTALKRLSPL
jgi:TrpR-related protein YerC/YecD